MPPTGDRSTAWPWFVAGGGVVAAATGIALWAVSGDRVASAESLAGQTPLREYGADAEALESSARQLRAGAVVFLAVGAAALVTAATGWLLRPGRDRSRDGRDRASDGRDRAPAATGVTARIEPAGLTIRFP